MNDNPTPSGITRRSFIKRSVVAAVAVSNMTIFSGLVRAEFEEYGVSIPPPCGLTLEPYEWTFDDKIITVWKCSATGPVCDKEIFCGRMYEMDPFTGDPILDPIENQMIWTDVKLNCATDRHPTTYCLRSTPTA
jgi:hypothetical protein